MSESVRYAILDTDFVSKANIIKSNNRVLADEVLKFPGYRFYCHQKMKTELGDHGTRSAQAWLDQIIASGDIRCYDDEQIIKELREAAGNHCYAYYQSYLVEGCNMIRSDFYEEYFTKLDEYLTQESCDDAGFLDALRDCESLIGHQKSYGEVKAFVLLKAISFVYSVEAFIFCSDDFDARRSYANSAAIPCISILSVFLKLWLLKRPIEEVQPYYQSFIDWRTDRENPQVNVRVWRFSKGSNKREKVPIENILMDIYAGKYEARKDGDLQLKTE